MHLKSLHGLYSDSLLEKRESSIVWKLVVSCCYLRKKQFDVEG